MKFISLLIVCVLFSIALQAQCPTVYATSGSGTVCQGANRTVKVNNSQTGYTYELRTGLQPFDVSAGFPVLTGTTGSAVSWTIPVETTIAYIVRATSPSGCKAYMSGTISLTATPSSNLFTVGRQGNCPSVGSVTLTGSQTGVKYQLRRNNANVGTALDGTGSALAFPPWANATGTYTVMATNTTTACTRLMQGNTTFDALPTQFATSGAVTVCQGVVAVITLASSQADTRYEIRSGLAPNDVPTAAVLSNVYNGDANGSQIQFSVRPEATTTYTIRATSLITGCTNIMSGSAKVTVRPVSDAYNVTRSQGCTQGGTITLSGSKTGIRYQLVQNGTTNVGTFQNGTGGPLTWSSTTYNGSYTIVATNTTNGCVRNMNGTVNFNNPIISFDVTGNETVCAGLGPIYLSGSQSGIKYQARLYYPPLIDQDLGSAVFGNGGPITLQVPVNGTTTGITVLATDVAANCSAYMQGSATINTVASPSAYVVGQTGTCAETGTIVHGSDDSQVKYELLWQGTTVLGTKFGNSSTITWTGLTRGGLYQVRATHQITGCQRTLNGNATFGATAQDIALTPTVVLCTPGTVTIPLNNSESGVSYQLVTSAPAYTPVGNPVAGNGGTISLSFIENVVGVKSYSLKATKVSSGCSIMMSGHTDVRLYPPVNIYSYTSSGCVPNGRVTLSQSQSGVDYQVFWAGDGSAAGAIQAGRADGGSLSWTVTQAGGYNVVAGFQNTACMNLMSGSGIVGTPPLVFVPSTNSPICLGDELTVSMSASRPGNRYQLLQKNAPPFGSDLLIGPVVNGSPTGQPISWTVDNVTSTGNYAVLISSTSGDGCTSVTEQFSVTVKFASPLYDLHTPNGLCIGSGLTPTLQLSGSTSGAQYQLFRNGIAEGPAVTGTDGSLSWAIVNPGGYWVDALSSNGCTRRMNGYINFSNLPTEFNLAINGSALACDNTFPLKTITLYGSEPGLSYKLLVDNTPTGDILPGTGSNLTWELQRQGNYTVMATNPTTQCSAVMGSQYLIVVDAPAAYSFTASGNCSSYNLTMTGSQWYSTYKAYINGVPTGVVTPGDMNGGPITILGVTGGGTVTVYREGVCSATLMGSMVLPLAKPIAYNVVQEPINACSGGSTTIHLTGSEQGVSYQPQYWLPFFNFLDDGTPPTPGTGLPLSVNINNVQQTYYSAKAINPYTQCTTPMIDRVWIQATSCSGRVAANQEEETTGQNVSSDEKFGFYVSPNPVQEVLEINSDVESLGVISIISSEGRELYSLVPSENVTSVQINVGGWSPGFYVARVRIGNGVQTQKFVKK